mgnify:FL=1
MDDDWDVITLTDDTTWFERIDAINRERQDDIEADPQGASEVCHFLEKHLREHGVLEAEERYEAVAEFLLGGGTIDVALVATLASSPCWRASVCKRCGNYLATKSAAMDEEMLTCLEACLAEMEHLPLEDVSSEIQLVYDSRPLDRAVLEDVVSKLRLAYPDLCPGMSKGEETVALENGKVVKWQKRLERPPALPTQRKRLNQELEDQAVEDVHIALKVYEMHKDLQWLVNPELCHYCSSFCESRCNLCFSTCRELERAKQHKMKATIKECLGMLAQHHHTLAALWTTRNEEELPWLRWNGNDSHHPDPIADPKLRVDYMHTLQKHFRGSAVSLKDYNTVSFRKSREQRQADIEEWVKSSEQPGSFDLLHPLLFDLLKRRETWDDTVETMNRCIKQMGLHQELGRISTKQLFNTLYQAKLVDENVWSLEIWKIDPSLNIASRGWEWS